MVPALLFYFTFTGHNMGGDHNRLNRSCLRGSQCENEVSLTNFDAASSRGDVRNVWPVPSRGEVRDAGFIADCAPMTRTPVSLLERLRKPGDQEAWAHFVNLYTPVVYSSAKRLVRQSNDAMDLVQDVFMVLVKEMPKFQYDPNRRFRAWLKTVINNKWRENCRRSRARPETVSLLADDDIPVPEGADQYWEHEYRRDLVHQALRLMKSVEPRTRQAFLEVLIDKRPAAEVAAELGFTVNALYKAKARILAKLRAELDGMLD